MAGIAYEDIDGPEFIGNRAESSIDLAFFGDVCAAREHYESREIRLKCLGCLEKRLLATTDEGYLLGARGSKCACYACTYSSSLLSSDM
jgi:hypothetical protein